MVKFVFTYTCVLVCLVAGADLSNANIPDLWYNQYANTAFNGTTGPNISLGVKKFVNSFTSYQFPNPFPPAQDPLSRLEFPIDQWFIGLSSKYASRGWSVTGSAWMNVNKTTSLKMQDSDWDDTNQPSQKTIFSESNCKLNQGLLVNFGFGCNVPYLNPYFLKPVLGYRYQYFFFTTYDGYQSVFNDDFMNLNGDGIDFKQYYNHGYIGLVFSKLLNMNYLFEWLPPTEIDLQCDVAFTIAKNEDTHLLRAGNRITTEDSRGHCWHISATANMYQISWFKAKFEADFSRITTYGNHELTNSALGIKFGFDGAKVWSDQASISAIGVVAF